MSLLGAYRSATVTHPQRRVEHIPGERIRSGEPVEMLLEKILNRQTHEFSHRV